MARSGGSQALPMSGVAGLEGERALILARAVSDRPDVIDSGSPLGIGQGLARHVTGFANKHSTIPGQHLTEFLSDLTEAAPLWRFRPLSPMLGQSPTG